jgi:2-dehydro-3-deoxygluconokinase
MDAEEIDYFCTSQSETKTNGLYLISTDESGEPHYSFWRNDSAAKQTLQVLDVKKIEGYIASSKYFHFSAIAFSILNKSEILISLLQKLHGETIITFDTNFRKSLWNDVSALQNFIEHSAGFIEILFVSDSDDENIYGKRKAEEAVNYYANLGYKTVIYRQGADDVVVKTADNFFSVPTFKNIKVVDTTAAGDAFNAGFISGMINGRTLEDSVQLGNGCAAIVIGERGALVDRFRTVKGNKIIK